MVYDTLNGKLLKGMASTELKTFSLGTIFLIFLGVFLALTSFMIGTFFMK